MDIKELYNSITSKNKEIQSKINTGFPITLNECIVCYNVDYEGCTINPRINCYTLDTLNKPELPSNFNRELFVAIEDNEPLRNSFRVERRTFCDYLSLSHNDGYESIEFVDRESPDYTIIDNASNSYFEVVEATNARDAQLNTIARKNSGRGKSLAEYDEYISKKHKQYHNTFTFREINGCITMSTYKGTSMTRKQIVNAVVKKVHKYNDYNVEGSKNIIVKFSSIGFDHTGDFKEVGLRISEIEEITQSDIDRIYVVSGMYRTLVEYDKFGAIHTLVVDERW